MRHCKALVLPLLMLATSLAHADCPSGGSTVSEGQGRTPSMAEQECLAGLGTNASSACGECTPFWINQQIDYFAGFGGGFKMECSGTFSCEDLGRTQASTLLER